VSDEEFEPTPAHLKAVQDHCARLYDSLTLVHSAEGEREDAAYRVIPCVASDLRCFAAPCFERTVKVCLLQVSRASLLAIDQLLLAECAKGRKPDFIVFPEGWIPEAGPIDVTKNRFLKRVSELVAKHAVYAILGTMIGVVNGKQYISSVLMNKRGEIEGVYHKRRFPGGSWHGGKGEREGLWDTEFGRVGILICYDIEQSDLLRQTLHYRPRILFNPAHIPAPGAARDLSTRAHLWNTAVDMANRLIEHLTVHEHTSIIKVDEPFPVGFSESQSLSPYVSQYVGGVLEREATLCTYLDREVENANRCAFDRLRVPVDRPRTDPRDDCGNRVVTRRLFGHRAFVTSFASVPYMESSKSSVRHLLTGSLDSTCRLWDLDSRAEVTSARMPHQSAVLSVCKPNAALCYAVDHGGELIRWRLAEGGVSVAEHRYAYSRTNSSEDHAKRGFWTSLCALGSSSRAEASPDHQPMLLCGGHSGVVQMFDDRNVGAALTLTPPGASAEAVRVVRSLDEWRVVVARGGEVLLYDLRKQGVRQRVLCCADAQLCSLLVDDVHHDTPSASAVSSTSIAASTSPSSSVSTLPPSARSTKIVAGDSQGTCHLVDLHSGESTSFGEAPARGPVVGMAAVNHTAVCLGSLYDGVRVGAPTRRSGGVFGPAVDQDSSSSSFVVYLELVGALHFDGRDLFASCVGDPAVTMLECAQNRYHRSWSDAWRCEPLE